MPDEYDSAPPTNQQDTNEKEWDILLRRQEGEIIGLRLSQGANGMILLGVEPGSAAARSGLALYIGKRLTKVDGSEIYNGSDIKAAAAQKETITLHFTEASASKSPRRDIIKEADPLSPLTPAGGSPVGYGRGRQISFTPPPAPAPAPVPIRTGAMYDVPTPPLVDQLQRLEHQKLAAVSAENYLAAKQFKDEIDALKLFHTVSVQSSPPPDRTRVFALEQRLAATEAALVSREIELDRLRQQSSPPHATYNSRVMGSGSVYSSAMPGFSPGRGRVLPPPPESPFDRMKALSPAAIYRVAPGPRRVMPPPGTYSLTT
eukprot:TRINITY_DN2207_c0_g1_i1.p1 TRINITY_DN2207_c0_g1~~TRINITY_DN2207_c0_g1_i1.p1  ORF type:complete len:317 (+),score=39.47 TRINITY_DN2207_c0_g1_i1:63-1013(+)